MRLVDHDTGEVVEPEVVEAAALDYVMLADEIAQDAADLADKRKRLEGLRGALLEVVRADEPLDAGPATIVRVTGNRPAQRVNRAECQRWAEELEDLGLGRPEFAPAGIALFRANQARIRAAGIPYEVVVPSPPEPADTLQIVPK